MRRAARPAQAKARNKKARQRTILYRALSCLEREISDRCDTGGLIHARNAEHDVLATFATECHEPYNVATIDMTIANRNRHVTTMLGDNVIKQRNRAGMQSQRIFNRLRKFDHVPSHDIAHSAGKPSHVVAIVALDACRELL